jgi:hypothetical protein
MQVNARLQFQPAQAISQNDPRNFGPAAHPPESECECESSFHSVISLKSLRHLTGLTHLCKTPAAVRRGPSAFAYATFAAVAPGLNLPTPKCALHAHTRLAPE